MAGKEEKNKFGVPDDEPERIPDGFEKLYWSPEIARSIAYWKKRDAEAAMEDVNVRIWYGSDDSYHRYAGLRLSTSRMSVEISGDLARKLATAVKDDRPVLAARIEEVCDEVGRRTSVSHEDLGDDVYDWLDDSSATARAYELLGLQPPSQE